MKRFLQTAIGAALVAGVAFGQMGPTFPPRPTFPSGPLNEIVPGYVLVKFTQDRAAEILRAEGTRVTASFRALPPQLEGAEVVNRIANTGWILWSVPSVTDPRALARDLVGKNGVFSAQPLNRIYPLMPTPNDGDWNVDETDTSLILALSDEAPTSFRRLWHLDDVGAEAAWDIFPGIWYDSFTKPRNTPLIAIIDTGADMDHPEFANAGSSDTDALNGGQIDKRNSAFFRFGARVPGRPPHDIHGHGTHVAGLAIAGANNGSLNGHGTIGTGFNSRAMILQVFGEAGQGTDADAAAAIYHATDRGADIINLSLGTENFSQLFQDAVTYAWQRGVLILAAGNQDGSGGGDLGPMYPAANSGALAVTANGPNAIPANRTYSGTGTYLDLGAPGGDLIQSVDSLIIQFVFSTAPRWPTTMSANPLLYPPFRQGHSYSAGTSMATPIVSGAAGLFYGQRNLRQRTGYANVRAYRALLRSAIDVLGAPFGTWTPTHGYGVLWMPTLMAEFNARQATVGAFEGIVYFNATPISLVPVRARRDGSTRIFSTTTLGNGTYRFDSLPPGNYTVTATAFGSSRTKRVVVRAGSDFTGLDFWCGPINPDTTPPTVAKFSVVGQEENAITIDHFGFDTESTIDDIRIDIGTSPGGENIANNVEVLIDSNRARIPTAVNLVPGTQYHVTALYRNGADLTTTRTTTFRRTPGSLEATFVSATMPTRMNKGITYDVTIRMKNTGTGQWRGSAPGGYALVAVDPNTGTEFGVTEVPLPTNVIVHSGVTRSFRLRVTPTWGGVSDFRWVMRGPSGRTFGGTSQNAPVQVNP